MKFDRNDVDNISEMLAMLENITDDTGFTLNVTVWSSDGNTRIGAVEAKFGDEGRFNSYQFTPAP